MAKRFVWLAVLCVATVSGAEQSRAGQNVHNLTVSRGRPFAHADFKVVPKAQMAEINTRPAGGDRFIAGRGRVFEGRRHGGATWVETRDTAGLYQARCARVPENTPSTVVCVGQFDPRGRSGGASGSRGGSGSGRKAAVAGPPWRSQLNEPGTHVIICNSYNTASDRRPGTDGMTTNQCFRFSGEALRSMYSAGSGNRVVLVKCGFGATPRAGAAEIIKVSRLPNCLRNLRPPVRNESVVTVDTLGHGKHIRVMQSSVRVMKCARKAPANAMDLVGRAPDFSNEIGAPEFALDSAAYAGLLAPFLKAHAFVNLLHCFTGEGYKSPIGPRPDVPSIAGQVKAAEVMPSTVTVTGVVGVVNFPVQYTDTNENGRWDPGEPISPGVPRPSGVGDRWDVN